MTEEGPFKEIVIGATPRSGSTLLCNDLTSNGLGRPAEHFLPLVKDFDRLRHQDVWQNVRRRGTSDGGIFAVKMMSNYAPLIDRHLGDRFGGTSSSRPMAHLAAHYSGAYWIYLSRLDTVSQAVSRLMSRLTGISHAIETKEAPFVPGRARLGTSEDYNTGIKLSDELIRSEMLKVDAENRTWEDFFVAHQIKPRRILYEDIVRDFSYISVIRADLKLPPAPAVESRNLLKLGNKRSDEIIADFKRRHPQRQTWDI